MIYKVDEVITVYYLTLDKTVGLTDVTLKTYNPSDELEDTLIMDEVGDGFYKKTFIPDVIGNWRVVITSIINGDHASKTYKVDTYKLDDIKGQLDTVEEKIDTIDGKADTVIMDVAATKGVVDGIVVDVAAVKGVVDNTEGKVDEIKTQTQSIEDKIDALEVTVKSGGYIV